MDGADCEVAVSSDGPAIIGNSSLDMKGSDVSIDGNGGCCWVVDGGGDGRLDCGDSTADGVDGWFDAIRADRRGLDDDGCSASLMQNVREQGCRVVLEVCGYRVRCYSDR